jgi:hypothetical protein
MATLYLFGIGGSGSRIIRSLTMLLAAGVKLGHGFNKVVPFVIDPDAANADKRRTIRLLETYQAIRREIAEKSTEQKGPGEGQFFGTEIVTLGVNADGQPNPAINNSYEFAFTDMELQLRDWLGQNTLPAESRALVDLLFDPASLSESLEVGFKGSPNVGSIVLNQLKNAPELQHFAARFQPGDRIFFATSIFGGTGAAGFPILLKNMRTSPSVFSGAGERLAQAKIGALTLLPYFKLEPSEESAIDSSLFNTKTKAALSYYEQGLKSPNGQHQLNALYYLGDRSTHLTRNSEGGATQRNDAHFVELVGALAVVNFTQLTEEELQRNDNFFEFSAEDEAQMTFSSLDASQTLSQVGGPLARFQFLSMWLAHHFEDTQSATYAKFTGASQAWNQSVFFKELRRFLFDFDLDRPGNVGERPQDGGFVAWLRELARNSRSFSPFNIDQDDFDKFITGHELKKGFLNTDQIGRKHVRAKLDAAIRQQVADNDGPRVFLKAFHDTSQELLSKEHSRALPWLN